MILRLKAKLSFPHLYNATTFNGEGTPKFQATGILNSDSPSTEEFLKAQDEVGKTKWGPKWAQIRKELAAKDRLALHDGNTKEHLDGYAGNMFFNASSKTRPAVIDWDRTPLVESDGRPYAGCICIFMVEIWAMDNQFGRRLNVSLKGIQFAEDGAAFAGGGTASPDDFDELPPPPNWSKSDATGSSAGLGV